MQIMLCDAHYDHKSGEYLAKQCISVIRQHQVIQFDREDYSPLHAAFWAGFWRVLSEAFPVSSFLPYIEMPPCSESELKMILDLLMHEELKQKDQNYRLKLQRIWDLKD